MIIVEYCKYGSLLRFLLNNRSGFVNQINGGTIDPSITTPSKPIGNDDTSISCLHLDAKSITNSIYIPGSIVSNGQSAPYRMNKNGT